MPAARWVPGSSNPFRPTAMPSRAYDRHQLRDARPGGRAENSKNIYCADPICPAPVLVEFSRIAPYAPASLRPDRQMCLSSGDLQSRMEAHLSRWLGWRLRPFPPVDVVAGPGQRMKYSASRPPSIHPAFCPAKPAALAAPAPVQRKEPPPLPAPKLPPTNGFGDCSHSLLLPLSPIKQAYPDREPFKGHNHLSHSLPTEV